MAKKKHEKVEEEVTEVAKEVKAPVEKPEQPATQALVKRGAFTVRTYSLDVHGKDFAKLADEFVSHTLGTTVELK